MVVFFRQLYALFLFLHLLLCALLFLFLHLLLCALLFLFSGITGAKLRLFSDTAKNHPAELCEIPLKYRGICVKEKNS